jgi:hypothetical protein
MKTRLLANSMSRMESLGMEFLGSRFLVRSS